MDSTGCSLGPKRRPKRRWSRSLTPQTTAEGCHPADTVVSAIHYIIVGGLAPFVTTTSVNRGRRVMGMSHGSYQFARDRPKARQTFRAFLLQATATHLAHPDHFPDRATHPRQSHLKFNSGQVEVQFSGFQEQDGRPLTPSSIHADFSLTRYSYSKAALKYINKFENLQLNLPAVVVQSCIRQWGRVSIPGHWKTNKNLLISPTLRKALPHTTWKLGCWRIQWIISCSSEEFTSGDPSDFREDSAWSTTKG